MIAAIRVSGAEPARKPPTLSGGEQVLLALHCFSRSGYAAIGIDTALEQLDPDRRAAVVAQHHQPLVGVVGVDRPRSVRHGQPLPEGHRAPHPELCLVTVRQASAEA